ncbi:hypothetical protein [Geodermatophilus sp. FMUSA9-8]|uniref:hypothetical protein n=1 Tax=Geodermatophilus sp. FMUSA9-8 TaxID=3120155 RepID=UPI0030093F19
MTRSTTTRRTLAAVALAAVCALPACSSAEGTDEAGASSPATSAASDSPAAPDETAEGTDAPVVDEAGEPVATDPPRPEATDVVLSNAYWDPAEAALFASGYVSPVIEDGGTCTIEVSRDGNTVRATTDGLADASTTVCGGLALPGDELRPGTWSVVLRYESGTASGESEPLEVEVPE